MSHLVRRQTNQIATGLSIPTEPQDEARILSILHLLAQYSGNKNYAPDVGISVIQVGDAYQLTAYPGTQSPVVYISFDPVKQELSTCPKHVLVRAIASAINKVGADGKKFEELAEKYEGSDFLARLFGLGGMDLFLTGRTLLPRYKLALPENNAVTNSFTHT